LFLKGEGIRVIILFCKYRNLGLVGPGKRVGQEEVKFVSWLKYFLTG
jgi:hypothetical protein